MNQFPHCSPMWTKIPQSFHHVIITPGLRKTCGLTTSALVRPSSFRHGLGKIASTRFADTGLWKRACSATSFERSHLVLLTSDLKGNHQMLIFCPLYLWLFTNFYAYINTIERHAAFWSQDTVHMYRKHSKHTSGISIQHHHMEW